MQDKKEKSQETKAAPQPRQYERWNSDIRKDCDIHAEDNEDLMRTYDTRKNQMLKAAEEITGLRLEPYVPTPDEAWGTYEIQVNPKYSGGYCVKQFAIEKQDVIPVDEAKGMEYCKQCPSHKLGTKVLYYMRERSKNVEFQGCFGRYLNSLGVDSWYVITVSSNATCRFHITPEAGICKQILALTADSETCCCGCCRNMSHASKHGCFCIGVFFRVLENGEEQKGEAPLTEVPHSVDAAQVEVGSAKKLNEEEKKPAVEQGSKAELIQKPEQGTASDANTAAGDSTAAADTTKPKKRTKIVLGRFNRWADDLVPYW
eukprot:CAMPEP_0197524014 /NCGR_PEP_ID=MMETSP1318-20131121/8804_1 /TAXON_ID=552666 /ORGANISM="Partenskyella glossopodia, Strain RCC365" /LENGTH=315 /DNA_ID=CAMNT_0043076857 /DNA_START=181 /DNA_END=1125 /DNA_ORIENTATION=+